MLCVLLPCCHRCVAGAVPTTDSIYLRSLFLRFLVGAVIVVVRLVFLKTDAGADEKGETDFFPKQHFLDLCLTRSVSTVCGRLRHLAVSEPSSIADMLDDNRVVTNLAPFLPSDGPTRCSLSKARSHFVVVVVVWSVAISWDAARNGECVLDVC